MNKIYRKKPLTQVVILAAGKGVRMLPLTEKTPKPLLMAGEKNLIEWKIATLPESVEEIVFVVGYMGDKIREYFGDNYAGRRIVYAEQTQLDGTMGALYSARHLLADRFLVMMGDDLYGKDDIARIIEYELAMGCYLMENVFRGGEILLGDDGMLDGVVEEKRLIVRGRINTGLYVLDERIFTISPASAGNGHAETGLPQTLARLGALHPVPVVPVGMWMQVTEPDDLARAAEFGRALLGRDES